MKTSPASISKVSPDDIFPDYVLVQRDGYFYLAVIGWDDRIAAFNHYMNRNFPSAHILSTTGWHVFKEDVYDLYDVIFEIRFGNDNEAMLFKLIWA